MGIGSRSVVKGWGRVLEVPNLVYELEDDGHMKLLGDRSQLDFKELKARVQYALVTDWRSTREIEDSLGDPRPSRDSTVRVLEALAREGNAERNPPISEGSKPGKRYTWRNLSSASPSVTGGG